MPEDGLPIVEPTDNYYQAFINWEKNEYWDIYTNGIRVLFGNAFGYVACEAAYEGGEE